MRKHEGNLDQQTSSNNALQDDATQDHFSHAERIYQFGTLIKCGEKETIGRPHGGEVEGRRCQVIL
jgi:hypothetical protein